MPDLQLKVGSGNFAIVDPGTGDMAGVPPVAIEQQNIYGAISGQIGDVDDPALSFHRFGGHGGSIRAVPAAAGLAIYAWASELDGDMPSVNKVEVSSNTAAGVAEITDLNLISQNPFYYIVRQMFLNVALPSLTISLAAKAAGRYSSAYFPGTGDLVLGFGKLGLLEHHVFTDLNIVRTRSWLLGNTYPRYIVLKLENRTNNTQVGSFNPHLYPAEAMVMFCSRQVGGTAGLPAGKPWVYATGPGLDAQGGVVGAVGGSHILVSEDRPAEIDLGGTGSPTGQNHVSVFVYSGADIHECKGVASAGATLAYPSFTGIPDGGFVVYFTATAQAVHAAPAEGVGIHAAGDTTAITGWSYTTRKVLPVGGAVAPANVALPSAVEGHVLAVCFWPEA